VTRAIAIGGEPDADRVAVLAGDGPVFHPARVHGTIFRGLRGHLEVRGIAGDPEGHLATTDRARDPFDDHAWRPGPPGKNGDVGGCV